MSREELQESSISRLSSHYSKHPLIITRDGPLENLWGKGEQAKYKKNIRARENYMKKKILARQLILKMFMLWPKKNSYKEFDNEKKIPAARKFPSPLITFLMVRP